jgi:DNA-binding MarR family transcriptional regulator
MRPDPAGSDHVDAIVEQWAVERPDLPTGALAIAARILRLQRFLDERVDASLVSTGLNRGEMNVLATLRRAGPPHELTPTELYQGLLLSSGAMTNRIDHLEDRGYVRRTPDHTDRRRIRVALTASGRELIDTAIDQHVTDLEQHLGFLDPDEHEQLTRLLRRVLVEFERDRGVPDGRPPS